MKNLWYLLISLRLGIYLILVFVFVALIGSFIMQGNPLLDGINQEVLFKWLYAYGLTNIKASWWLFALILITFLLGINTVLCNTDRFFSLFALRKRLRKRLWIELSSYAMHLGFLIVLVGHLISSTTGFKSKGNIAYQGVPLKVPYMDYYIRLDDLKVEYYPNGYPKDFESKLTVIEDGRDVLNKAVMVNHPLSHKGAYLYQVDSGEAVSGANLLIGGEKEGKIYSLGFDEKIALPETGYSLQIGRLFPDFDTTSDGEAYSRSPQFNNPAVELLLYKDDQLVSKSWAFYRDFKREPFSGTKTRVFLVGFPAKKYVILDVQKDEGAFIALAGSLIFLSSSLIYFTLKKYKYREV
ncbi:MAG: cytochrome c biogenesis protein ResB [Nitrospirae bacterium]|nr:cytochrome c biogenesis protein ResB [Nitrospirota bacterium]